MGIKRVKVGWHLTGGETHRLLVEGKIGTAEAVRRLHGDGIAMIHTCHSRPWSHYWRERGVPFSGGPRITVAAEITVYGLAARRSYPDHCHQVGPVPDGEPLDCVLSA